MANGAGKACGKACVWKSSNRKRLEKRPTAAVRHGTLFDICAPNPNCEKDPLLELVQGTRSSQLHSGRNCSEQTHNTHTHTSNIAKGKESGRARERAITVSQARAKLCDCIGCGGWRGLPRKWERVRCSSKLTAASAAIWYSN